MAAIPRPGSLQTWLQPPAPVTSKTTHKRKATDDDADDENAVSVTEPVKKKRTASKAAKTTSRGSKKAADPAKQAKKLYDDTLKAIDKKLNQLDRKAKTIGHRNRWDFTTSDYAVAVTEHIPAVKTLMELDVVLAFNLLLSMGDASHGDMDATPKMCGEPGDATEPTFKKLDQLLLPLIEKREKPAVVMETLPEVPRPMTRKDADARRSRRETCEDWIAVALSDLQGEVEYLEAYGTGHDWMDSKHDCNFYFEHCIAKLKEIDASRKT